MSSSLPCKVIVALLNFSVIGGTTSQNCDYAIDGRSLNGEHHFTVTEQSDDFTPFGSIEHHSEVTVQPDSLARHFTKNCKG